MPALNPNREQREVTYWIAGTAIIAFILGHALGKWQGKRYRSWLT